MRTTNPWMCQGLWHLFSGVAMARPRECLLECPFLNAPVWGKLQSLLFSYPVEPQAAAIGNGIQNCFPGVSALCSTHYAWKGFLPPSLIRTMAVGPSLEGPEMASIWERIGLGHFLGGMIRRLWDEEAGLGHMLREKLITSPGVRKESSPEADGHWTPEVFCFPL